MTNDEIVIGVTIVMYVNEANEDIGKYIRRSDLMKKIKEKVIEKKEKIITWAKRFSGEMMRFLLNDQVYIGIILLIV